MISALYEKRLKRDLFRLSILTLLTVVIWIGIATYRALSKSQVKPEVKKQIMPLTPSLDLDTMKNIKQRYQVEEAAWEEWQPKIQEGLLVPDEELDLTELEATASGEIELPEEATASGR